MASVDEGPITLTLHATPVSLQISSFTGREALNEPYRFEVEVLATPHSLAPSHLLRQSAFLRYGLCGKGVHGIIQAVDQRYINPQLSLYRLSLVPRLLSLQGAPRKRVFQDISVPGILHLLLKEHGMKKPDYRFELSHEAYELRTLCLQYAESDLQFLQRLCEEEGIHYHFEHSHRGHVMVIADESRSFQPLQSPQHYRQESSLKATQPGIYQLQKSPAPGVRHDSRLAPGPSDNTVKTCVGAANQNLPPDPARRGLRALEQLRGQQHQAQGASNQPDLSSGQVFQMLDHPRARYNQHWLLTEVHHLGKQRPSSKALDQKLPAHAGRWWQRVEKLIEAAPLNVPCPPFNRGYRNHFRAIPWNTAFRPQRRHAAPLLVGYLVGRIAGGEGEPARLDSSGRINVTLEWTASAGEDIWIPAIPGSDPARLPAGGSRVLISFIDNDPNQPLICGLINDRPPTVTLDPNLAHEQENEPLTLTLTAHDNQIRMTPHSITLSGPFILKHPPLPCESAADLVDLMLIDSPPECEVISSGRHRPLTRPNLYQWLLDPQD